MPDILVHFFVSYLNLISAGKPAILISKIMPCSITKSKLIYHLKAFVNNYFVVAVVIITAKYKNFKISPMKYIYFLSFRNQWILLSI